MTEELTPLQKANAAKKANREAGIKVVNLSPAEKAKANPKSLRMAITAKCYECANDQKAEVTHCHITDCALWNVRPWQRKGSNSEEQTGD